MTVIAVAALGLGGLIGYSIGGAGPQASSPTPPSSSSMGPDGHPRQSSRSRLVGHDSVSSTRERSGRPAVPRARQRVRSAFEAETNEGASADEAAREGPPVLDETDEKRDPARLAQELTACLDEREELLGKPLELPGEPDERFGSAAVSSGIRSAIDQAGVAGEVEATDCSEHPCIVFGRLAGDEEDMEKIERAEALAPYESDVLSLLFWATSVDDPSAPAHETGLFALAFYTDVDRQELGDELDRRIRARVMEYWNTDKPGQSVSN